MPTCQPLRMANFSQPQSSSSQEKRCFFFSNKQLHVLWMKVLRTCLLEKLIFLTYFDVLTKAGFPLVSYSKVRQWIIIYAR